MVPFRGVIENDVQNNLNSRSVQGLDHVAKLIHRADRRWTVNNPGGLPVHYGVVHYGRDPKTLNQTAKNPIRLNPYHSSTVFRVNLYDLAPKTTYYYTVESIDSRAKSDGVKSPVKAFATR